MKPIIGITINEDENNSSYFISNYYSEAVKDVGGLPIFLPSLEKKEDINRVTDLIDGLILSGGGDIDPIFMGEEPLAALGRISPRRDEFEIELIKRAGAKRISILGICRGMQLLNIAFGGTIYQDIDSQLKNRSFSIKHSQDAPKWYPTHKITLTKASRLFKLLQTQEFRVNSYHHQAVAKVAPGFSVTATAIDGIVEAMESEQHNFILGVQWHPECMWEKDEKALQLFKALINSCLEK